MNEPLIIAHRGAWHSANVRDNTLEAFHEALRLGVDMIECDVRRTRDGTVVLHHDPTIDCQLLAQLSYRELNRVASSLGFQVPALTDLVAMTNGKTCLDVEIKEEGYESELVGLLEKHLQPEQFVITSFNDSTVRAIKRNHPHVRAGLILGKAVPKNVFLTRFVELFPGGRCRRTGADFLVPHYRLLKFGFLERARKHNRAVFVWTVNDEPLIRSLLRDKRLAAIITDRPDLAVRLRQQLTLRDDSR